MLKDDVPVLVVVTFDLIRLNDDLLNASAVLLVDEIGRRPGAATVVHADVFADDAATEIAPAVLALGIEYEPVAYLIDAEGVLVDRLDAVWDAGELAARLDLLLA